MLAALIQRSTSAAEHDGVAVATVTAVAMEASSVCHTVASASV